MSSFRDEDADTNPIAVPTHHPTVELTDEEQRALFIQKRAILEAHQEMERERLSAAQVAASQEAAIEQPEEDKTYDEVYFPTKIPALIALPFLSLVLLVTVSAFLVDFSARYPFGGSELAIVVCIAAAVFCVVWIVREFLHGLRAGIHASGEVIDLYEPRILWLGMLGKGARFNTTQVAINEYYGSFFNFIPGWNSWTLQMDTPAVGDERKLQTVKYVRSGDKLAAIIAPGMMPKKRKVFKRR